MLILLKPIFINRILSFFDECFDKISKTIAFAYNVIDSAKVIFTHSSFKDLIEIIRKITNNIIRYCKNIINFIKWIKEIKITDIPDLISKSKEKPLNFLNI